MPEREHLHYLREHISHHHKKLNKLLTDDLLTLRFPTGLSNDYKLKKAPQGYSLDHPGIDLLRYKNFTIGQPLTDQDLKDKKISGVIANQFKILTGLNAFLRVAGADFRSTNSTTSAANKKEYLLAAHFEM